jgi:hypothetical protein
MSTIILKNHQKLPNEFMKNNFGLILYHGTGTGKTITALAAMYQFNKHIVIIGPKSSNKAFEDEILKLKFDRGRFTIYTYAKIKKDMYQDINLFKNKCVIVDEAHNLRNDTKDNMFLVGILNYAHKVMMLSATPIINYMNDISPLINVVKQEDVLSTDKKLFDFFYFDEQNMRIRNSDMLANKLKNSISYYDKKDVESYPESGTIVKQIIMTKDQIKEYASYVKNILFKHEVPPDGQSLFEFDFARLRNKTKNAFLTATRQLSNTIDGGTESPKILELVKIIEAGPYPVITYSNFLKNGVYPVAKKLEMLGISYAVITGGTSQDKLIKTVNEYNSGKFKVLLISSAGSESLDLKNTRQIHIMEPHWNEPKIDQVIGRAIRYKSHISLPKNDRNVTIYRWVSVFDKEMYANISADEYLIELGEKKRQIFNTFKNILIESSIENQMNKKGGYITQYNKYLNQYKRLKNI